MLGSGRRVSAAIASVSGLAGLRESSDVRGAPALCCGRVWPRGAEAGRVWQSQSLRARQRSALSLLLGHGAAHSDGEAVAGPCSRPGAAVVSCGVSGSMLRGIVGRGGSVGPASCECAAGLREADRRSSRKKQLIVH